MNYKVAVIPGDGIGPEIIAEARKVLDKTGEKYGHTFEYQELLMGGCSIDAYGEPLTDETLEKAKASDSVLLGAVGGDVGTKIKTACKFPHNYKIKTTISNIFLKRTCPA